MVVYIDLYLNASKEEHTIFPNNFKDIKASTKHSITFPNNDFCPNSLNQEINLNDYK